MSASVSLSHLMLAVKMITVFVGCKQPRICLPPFYVAVAMRGQTDLLHERGNLKIIFSILCFSTQILRIALKYDI